MLPTEEPRTQGQAVQRELEATLQPEASEGQAVQRELEATLRTEALPLPGRTLLRCQEAT